MQKELMSNSKKEESMLYVMNKYELEQKGYSGGKDDNANVGVYYITDIHLPQHGICPNIGLKSKKKKIDIIIKKMFKNNLNQLDIPFLINMDKSVEEFEWRWRLEYNRDILWFGGDISESIDDVELFVLHQANLRILSSISKRKKIPMDKIPVNLDTCGNTSAASVPILLDKVNKEGKIKENDLILLAGFGAGLTWGAALIQW